MPALAAVPTVRYAGRNVSVATAVLFPSQYFARVGIADDHRASAVLETFFLLHSHFYFLHCGAGIQALAPTICAAPLHCHLLHIAVRHLCFSAPSK